MVDKEGPPDLAGGSGMARPTVAANRARTGHDAEFEELAADELGAPVRVLAGHGGNQLTSLGTQSRSAQAMA
jgi:hypothetical protein